MTSTQSPPQPQGANQPNTPPHDQYALTQTGQDEQLITRPGTSPDGEGGNAPVLRVNGLSRSFGSVRAVNNLSFEVQAGEVLAFLGPNGSGKSTTVSMILGLIRPTAGSVELYGHDIRQHPEIISKGVGAIIENPAFYPYLSGRDNLRAFAKAIGGVSNQRVDELLQLVRMNERARDKYKTYSLGMKQRLGIALTLLQNPGLVILDEPTNGLDPAGQREIREFIPDLARHGHAVLLASHLLNEVEQVSDRVIIIRRGEMVRQGTVRDLVQQGGVVVVRVDPGQINGAVETLRRVRGVEQLNPGAEPGEILVSAPAELGGDLNRALAGQGIWATAIAPRANSLENIFLQLTEGSSPGEQEGGERPRRRFGRR